MDPFGFLMTICAVVGGAFLAWLYTKPGKKWLKDL